MASSSISSKTVFLLDHSHWMREPSSIQVEIEWGNNVGGNGAAGQNRNYYTQFIPPVTKSLWTCVIECVLEYSRVVTDLFANERLLRFGLCQSQSNQWQLQWLNNWELLADGAQQQCINYFAEKLGNSGPPPLQPSLPHTKSSSTVVGLQIGIKQAIEALAQPTPAQEAFMQGHGKSSLKAINKGRIICVTTLTPHSVGKGSNGEDLEEFFANALNQHNGMIAPASDHLLPILECEFVLISVHPLGKQKFSTISPRAVHEVPPILKCERYVVDAEQIVNTMVDLCVAHQELVSTVVTGIPMKEEQNAQHSSNYDVKLWHPRMLTSTSADNQVLKWSSPLTPKSGGLQLHHCTSAVRITPVDVNGRPTTCLTSFLMNGRSVWLEMLKKGAGKTTSHLLTSHGGEMWLHVIETARNVLEDPPSISEGVGGRVTDYRIPDFADLIRAGLLVPFPKNYYENVAKKPTERESGNPFVRRRSSAEDLKKPIEMAKERLSRKSAFWPMVMSGSLLFPMSVHIESLLRLMPQDAISDMEKVECDKCIWNLMSVEARGEPPVPSGHHKKGQKRDDQWRAVYNELETFIKANQHSENHKKVLECFLESRQVESKIDSRSEDKDKGKQKVQDMEKALASLASFGTSTTSLSKTTTDSPMSPPPTPSAGKSDVSSSSTSGSKPTLLSLYTAKTEKKNVRVLTNTKLYSHLSKDSKEGEASSTAGGDSKSKSSTGKSNTNGSAKKVKMESVKT